jgi:small subunit ribosomal protein S13
LEETPKPNEPKQNDSLQNADEEKIAEQKSESQDEKGEQVEKKTETADIPEEKLEPTIEETAEKVESKEKKKDTEKTEEKKEKPKKKGERDKDFKFIVRLSNTDVNGEKNIVYGLSSIKGIGVHMATLIVREVGIDRYTKIGDLKDSQIEQIQEIINNIKSHAPNWMLNHRKDIETGNDIHLIGSDIDMRLRDEINILKKIRSYRGVRHERSLRVRGQRTRANNRRGLALGVSKKREGK